MKLTANTLRILFGLLWLWAGVAKLKDPTAFSFAIRNYHLLSDPWIAAAALFLPALECVAAMAVIFRKGSAGAIALLWGSLLVFTVAIAISWGRGLDIECGCFGLGGSTVNYPVKIAQNVAMLAVGAWLWWWESRPTREVQEELSEAI
ncbi:MAG: hypothetical protein KDN20_24860 [Verrucomicrobiae bacterium]|nr:hypothetical protein [Verrucomicrobiae bacterium]